MAEPAAEKPFAHAGGESVVEKAEKAASEGEAARKPGGGVAGFVDGENVEGGESGAVESHVVADRVGFQAVVTDERAITEMEILEVSVN